MTSFCIRTAKTKAKHVASALPVSQEEEGERGKEKKREEKARDKGETLCKWLL